MPDVCQLAQLAFCDTFQTIVGGGRAGDLDPAKWSFTRATQANNPGAGIVNNYLPFNAEFCRERQVRLAPSDSFICGEHFGESNHWMEGMTDGGSYMMNSLRARQPFDFAGRTGNVVWDVDAKTEGSHSFWPEVWLTDEPVQGPHEDHPGTHMYPRNGIGLVFDADWCGGAAQTMNALRTIEVFSNYQVSQYYDVRSPCFTTQDDMANHFQLKISSTNISVWASDAGGTGFREIANVSTQPLPLTRGYLSFQHAQYAAGKFNSTDTMTYHWHALGFDGPVLATDRGYEVLDALQKQSDGSINLGYQTHTPTFTLPNVNLTGVAKAYLTYDVYWFSSPKTLVANINGVDRAVSDPNPDWQKFGSYQWRYIVQPIALSDLRAGSNTVTLKNTGCQDQCPTVANIDLELVLN
ncbi:MAG TPA: hypothetical protein VHI95_02845 [Acidimicrobiales bacterium]|nr:hypothetical protein [Acidimicrobiales bacterium]